VPFNQLILPLLGGYILITYANCFIYWSSRQAKEHLLFASAFAGAVLAIFARFCALLLSKTSWGAWLYHALHNLVNYEGIGTAGLALALGLLGTLWINRAWPAPEAALWLYGRGSLTQLEALFYSSFNGSVPADNAVFRALPIELPLRLLASIPFAGRSVRRRLQGRQSWKIVTRFNEALNRANPAPLMVTMRDRKVYVGFLQHFPSLTPSSMSHINLEVLLSGYREKDDLHVELTDNYIAIFTDATDSATDLPSYKVLPVADIASASFFDVSVFQRFQAQRGLVESDQS